MISAILGVRREDAVFELPRHADRVNEEPHEMRGIEFEAEPRARDEVEDGLHRCRSAGEIDAGRIILPSHGDVELFADGQVFLVEDIGVGLGLIFHGGVRLAAAEGADKLAAEAMAKFQGANKFGVRGGALARIGIGVVGSEVLDADDANAGVARRSQNLIDRAVTEVGVEVRTRRHHHAFVAGLRGKGELLRRVRRDDGELGIGRIPRRTSL